MRVEQGWLLVLGRGFDRLGCGGRSLLDCRPVASASAAAAVPVLLGSPGAPWADAVLLALVLPDWTLLAIPSAVGVLA